MPQLVTIAVRPLVEYAYRSGSLDGGFRTVTALTEGTKAHRMVQQQYGADDQHEVHLRAEIPEDGDLLFVVEGRCDGLLMTENGPMIEEIKSTSGDLANISEDSYPVHWAQAKCYAYMYAKAEGLASMGVRLTYVQVDSGEQKRFEQVATLKELESLVREAIARYAPYVRMLLRHRELRDASIAQLSFPFQQYRAGQRKFAAAVYRSIEEGHNLFARAPTGIGKTMSTLFPAIKAMGEGKLQQIFYLTARTTTRAAAEDAFVRLKDSGLHTHVVTITAKDKICFREEGAITCDIGQCPYAEGYFDRINGAVLDLLSSETLMTRETIERYARKHSVCPFEFSLDAAYAADTVICDYNYVFDPRISLKRMLAERKGATALLVDEAHNLVDRAREMFSSALGKRAFLELQRAYKGLDRRIHDASKAVNTQFIALRKRCGDEGKLVMDGPPEELVQAVEAFVAAAERRLAEGAPEEQSASLLDVFFAASNWMRIYKLIDERYIIYAEEDRGDLRIRLFCLDPSALLRQMRKGYRSQICFSATLTPLNYYMDMLGADSEDYSITVPSPFSPEQWEASIVPISTRYRDRESSLGAIALKLYELLRTRPGNYLFFFPSYTYMNAVYEAFLALLESGETDAVSVGGPNRTAMVGVPLPLEGTAITSLLQISEMAEEERDRFLGNFQAGRQGTLAGFAVLGGIFSEGVDLVGDRLQGVVIVGVGMPQLGLERNLIQAYFNEQGKRGFDYAYVYPGMSKVLQAGGRLIRSEQDSGILMLIDDRYLQSPYNRLLPEEWGVGGR